MDNRMTMARLGTFHQRFDIEVSTSDAQIKFVNRVHNRVFGELLRDDDFAFTRNERWRRDVADGLGAPFHWQRTLREYVGYDFHNCLCALETLYKSFSTAQPS